MTKLERGMVVDVDLNPTKGSETGKIRPCIVVTNNTYNERVPVIFKCKKKTLSYADGMNFCASTNLF